MANKKKGPEGFNDWYERNGGQAQETQTRQTSNSSGSAKPQAFNDWYNAGANEPYTTLRFLADDMAGSSRVRAQSRSAWLQEMQYKQQKQQIDKTNSDIAAYNEFQRRQYNQALGNAIGKMAAAPIKGGKRGNIDPATLASIGGKVAKGAGNKANSTINVVRNNWEVPDGGNQPRSRGTNDAPYVVAPSAPVTDNSEYEARRMALDELIRANRNMNSVTGSYVMDDLLGYQREKSPERTEQKEDTTPQHVQQFATLSSADIKARQDRYNEMVASDLTLARNLLSATFAGVEPARSMARDELGNKWGINAYDAEELRLLADRLERGVVYTDKDGNETTWDKLYNNALNREKAEASILPPEEQAYVQSLYDMTSDELEKKYGAQDDETKTGDLSTAEWLLNATVPWFEYDENSEVGQARARLNAEYGIDPTNENDLRTLIENLKTYEAGDVIYTDSNGKNYTYQDLYYNAENREKFNKLETDSDALDLVAEGLRLQKQIDMFNAYIVDAGTAAEYAPMVTDLGNKKNLIAERLNERGYDLDRMLGYLNTEDAKQRFLMQSQATAKWTEENPVLANIAAMLATPVQAVEWMANNTGSGNPEDLKNYVPMNYFGMDATNFSSAVRGTTSNMIQNEMLKAGFSDKFAELASETYSGVLSAAQSRILALACTAMAGPGAGEIISLAIMGSSAASDTLRESIDRGLDNRHAIITAMSAGVAEAAFEELSLDKFLENVLDPANLPKGILDALRKSQLQRLVEGSEEFFTDIANAISDRIINGDMSEYNTNIRAYMQQNGGDRIDAVKKANKDFVTQVLQSAFGGYIGGGGFGSFALNSVVNSTPFQQAMSPFNNAYNRYQQNRAYQNIGASVIENQNTGALVDAAQMSGDEQLRGLAEQVAEAQTIQKPSRRQQKVYEISTGKLAAETAKTNFQKATESNESVLRQAIETELKNRGLDATDNNISAVRKALSGEELTYDEKYPSYRINAPEIAEAMKERTPEIEEEASKISQEAFTRVKNVQKMANADFSERVSKTGEVINTKTGKAVEIGEFVKDGDNGITLTTKDGGRVSVADLKFADTTQAALYEEVDTAGFSPEVANQVVRGFDGKGTAAVSSYMNGMLEGMAYGRTHQNTDMNFSGPFYADLSASQKDLAIKLGQMERGFDTEKATAKINELKALSGGVQRKGSVTGVTSSSAGLNNAQRTGIRTIEMLVDNGALTNNFHFFSSVDNGKGRVLSEDVGGLKKGASAPNGFYDPKTGDIYIDVNAGNNGEGTVLFTAAHEVTHFVKQWSPNKFNDLANFLVQEYHGAGISVDGLVREQMRKGSSRHLSYDEAFEEFVADSMQTMFTDGNLAAKLMDLKTRDKTLFDKIMDFVKKLQTGINKVYARYTPDSEEAKALSQIKGAVDRLADTFAEGITAATENYNATDASNLSAKEIKELKAKGLSVVNGLIVADNLEALAAQVRKPGSLNIYSYRTEPEWEKSVIAQWGDTEETRRYINAVSAFTDAMVSDDAIRRVVPMGSYAYDKYGPLRDNVEYVITFDMDTSCPRTFQFTKYRDHLQAYAKRPLTYNESVNLLELMRVYGQNIPCSYCYVENKRVLLSASYNNFFKFRNDVLNEKDATKAMAKMYGYNTKKKTLADASQKVFDRWRSDMSYNPTIQDVWNATQTARNSVFNFLDSENERGNIDIKKSQKAIEELVCDHFGVKGQTPRAEVSGFVSEWIYDTFAEKEHTYLQKNDPSVSEVDVRALALNHEALAYAKSASSAKTVSSYVPYTDQLKNITPEVKAYVIGMGGIRKHSSNDFRIDYVQDYLMFYADLAAGGWTGHTYTKSPDFVKIFGNTGDRINMSIAMTDGPDGTVRENELEGMYWKVAKELRNAYKNAGVMSMVTSDAQLSYALNADWIDMIIPFHASSLDKHVWYDLRHWFDYTSKQLERFLSSKDMKLALIQKALDDAGVEYSSDGMKQKLIDVAREKGAGALSKDTDKIKQAEISRLVKLAAKNGVQFNNKMSAKEIETAYNTAFGVKTLYNAEGKRIKPHFLPGETVVDGVTIPGHGNDVQKYLDLCREYGVHPRFDGVAVQDKNGNYINVVDHEGYLKLIKETARTDSDQEKIQFNFDKYDDYLKMTPMEYALQQLHDNADIGMYDNMSEDPMAIQKKFIDDYLGKNRDIGWLPEYAEDFKEYREEQQNKENTGDVKGLPKYQEVKQSARTDEFPDRVDSDVDTSNPDYHYSARITDPTLLDSLNNQEYITTYRTMQIIDGGLYSPMNSQEDVDASGKRALGFRSELGQWEMATEAPEKTKPKKLKSGEIVWTYDLKDPHGDTQAVAYNPYEHSANYVLNDQFTGAYKRNNIVVVECRVPESEANGAYRAEKAHNATGWTSWHKGPVAAKIAKATKNSDNPFDRQLFLSRYLMPVRIVPDSEVAKMYGDYLRGTGVEVNWNVVSPSLLEELVKQGVPVTDKPSSASVKDKMPENLRQMMNQTRGEDAQKFSARDEEYLSLAQDPEENTKRLTTLVKQAANDAGYTVKGYHGTTAQFNVFKAGDIGIHFGKQKSQAKTRVGRGKNTRIISAWLKMQNPINIDYDLGSWDADYRLADVLRDMGIITPAEHQDALYVDNGSRMVKRTTGSANNALRNILIGKGYDGIEYLNDFEADNATAYIAFSSDQIKSADPVTYDNAGNVIPLSERFNEGNQDIRYSDRDSEGNTLTQAQQEYFKDSKIRDEDGNLLVVYHGSPSTNITVFDKSKGGQHTGAYEDKAMFWFTDNKKFADDFSYEMEPGSSAFRYTRGRKGTVYAGYLNIENMFDLTNPTPEMMEYLNDKIGEERTKKLFEYGNHQAIKFDIDYADLANMGFDGIKARLYTYRQNNDAVEYGVFDSNQFKRADNKTPTENPDIRYSDRDAEYLELAKNPSKNRKQLEQMVERAAMEAFPNSQLIQDGKFHKMWHHTNAEFTEFLPGTSKSTGGLKGIYFTPQETSSTSSLGKYHKAYYLNVENMKFAIGLATDKEYVDKLKRMQAGANSRVELAEVNRRFKEETGVDAFFDWQNGWYNIMTPEQIKSADLVTYDDNGNIIPLSERFSRNSPDLRFSERDPDAMDTRTVLSNALLETAKTDLEKKFLQDYQSKIAAMNEEQNRLNEIRNDIRNMTFGKAPHTKEHLKSLKEEATRLANRIYIYDKQLLRIEAMNPMKAVIDREKARVQTRIRAEQAAFMTDYKNKVSSREYIARIEHEVKGLRDRLMHPSAKTIIPESFAKPVSQFISAIDFGTYYADGTRRSGKANVTREQLRQRLEALGNSIDETSLENEYGQLDFDPMMVEWIKNTVQYLNDNFSADDTYVLRKMSAEELANLYKIVTSLRTAVNNSGKMYTNMAASIGSLGADTIDYLEPIFNRERSRVGARVYKTLGWDYAQPVTVFDRFGDAGKKVFKGLLNGQRKEADNVKKILDFVDTAYTREEVNSWQDDMKNVTIDGTDYQIPASYIMELYCMMKDADARRHIVEGGGIRFDDLTYGRTGRRRTRTFDNTLITEDEVNAMIGTLTDRQKEAANQIQEFMDRVGADWGNEISMRRFGYHAFGQIPNYYPIKTIKQGSEYEAQQKRANIYALLNKSFTKERITNANNTVIIGDIFKTFSDHMSEMAVYNAWALPVIDTIKWFNYREAQDLDAGIPERSVKDAIRKAYGAEKSNPADEYIRRLLESINGQRSGGLSESLAFHSLRMMNRVAVAANIRVAVQQPFSITRAFTLISPRYIRPMSVATMRQEYNEMVENSSFGRWKGMGYYDVDIARPLQTQVLKSETLSDRVTQHSMRLAELGDQFTWSTLWHACKLEAQAQHKTGDALIKATTEKFDEIISRTQVVDSVLKKSQWMRSDSFWHRMTSAFMSEPMTSYNLLLQQYDKFVRDAAEVGRQESVRRNWRSIAGALTVFAITELVNAMVTAPIDAMRDDDDYKTYWEKLLEKFKKNATQNAIPTNMMPFLADITDYLIYGSQDRADLSIYTKAIDTAKMIYQAIANDDGLTMYKRNKLIMAALTMTSQITGLPISNTARDAISIWNTVTDRIDFGSLKFQTAEDKNTVGYKQFLKALKAGNDDRKDYLYMQMQSNGVEHDTAYTGVKNLLKDEYYDGTDVTDNLVKVIQYFDEQPYQMAWNTAKFLESWWTYCKENPSDERVLTYSAYEKYYAEAMPAGIDVKTYEKYYTAIKDLKKEQVIPIIDEQPLTDEQKDTLYYMKKYGAKAIGDTPWHQ